MDSSDSDDKPLSRRFANAQLKDDAGRRSSSGSPLPDWLSQNNSPVKTLEVLSDSDEVLEVGSSDDGAEDGAGPEPGSAAAQKNASRKRRRGAASEGMRNAKRVLLSSENDESDDGTKGGGNGQQSDQKRQKLIVATQQSQRFSSQNSAEPPKKQQARDPPSRKPAGSAGRPTLGKIAEVDEQHDEGGEGTQANSGSQAVKGPKTPISKAAVLAPVAGEVPVMMPDKLPTTKFIVELEGGNDSSVDLAGDAGVVGRWLVEGDDSNPELKIDLKGVVYAATTMACATTLCVVNLSATEARVEAMAQQYIQLRPVGGLGSPGEDDADDNYFMYDDDDNYQYEGNSQHPGTDEAGPSSKGPKKKPKAAPGKVKKAPAKRAGAGGKPAKKKPTKAAAGARGKAKK